MDRYHPASAAIDRAPVPGSAAYAGQTHRDALIQQYQYIIGYQDDPSEIRDWRSTEVSRPALHLPRSAKRPVSPRVNRMVDRLHFDDGHPQGPAGAERSGC